MLNNLVKEFFKENEWQFSEIDKKNVFFFGISGKNGNFQCIADVFEENNQFIFFSVCGVNAPLEKRKRK